MSVLGIELIVIFISGTATGISCMTSLWLISQVGVINMFNIFMNGYILNLYTKLFHDYSGQLQLKHQYHFTQPNIQSKTVGILWMVPIYALTSFLSLCFPFLSLYIDLCRDCYEVY